MRQIVRLGDKEMEFKASAATPILYKQVFKSDLLKDIGTLKENKGDDTEKASQTIDIFQQLAFIMYLEGNCSADDIWSKLSQQEYIRFLMSVDNNAIVSNATVFLAIYNGNTKTLSESKNE